MGTSSCKTAAHYLQHKGPTVVIMLVLLHLLSASPVHNRFITFHITESKVNQTEAGNACRKQYTDLVTVYSAEENNELVNLISSAGSGWIGLYRGQFSEKWSNGDPVTFKYLTQDCGTWRWCATMKADGLWENLQCSEKRSFMCYEDDIKTKRNYHLINKTVTWHEAQHYCRRLYTDLISIRDQQQNEEVMSKGVNSTQPFWIGLLCDEWQWTDGRNSTYRDCYRASLPSDSDESWYEASNQNPSDHCVKLAHQWHSVPCSNTEYALCYNENIHLSDKALNWEEALEYCQEENKSGILVISDENTQKDLQSVLKKMGLGSDPLWVGLRQSLLLGFWIWLNGEPVFPYSNWDEDKQPEHHLSQHCGAIDPQRGFRWRDMNCLSRHKVLCLIKRSP